MGKIKYIKRIREIFNKNPVVQITSLKRLINTPYIYTLINYLTKKNEIKRITKGYYSIYDDPSLAVYCFKPSYLGLQDALSIHNLWEQETNVIIISAKKIRPGIRKMLGSKIIIKRISPKYFFGFEHIKLGKFYIPVSDIEKTFIDMIYFKQKINKETLENFKKRINAKKLKRYLKHYPAKIKNKIWKLFKES